MSSVIRNSEDFVIYIYSVLYCPFLISSDNIIVCINQRIQATE